jgi:hypothetical protein
MPLLGTVSARRFGLHHLFEYTDEVLPHDAVNIACFVAPHSEFIRYLGAFLIAGEAFNRAYPRRIESISVTSSLFCKKIENVVFFILVAATGRVRTGKPCIRSPPAPRRPLICPPGSSVNFPASLNHSYGLL